MCLFCYYFSKENKPKFIIDNDAGGDDALAIFIALLYEKHFDGYVFFVCYFIYYIIKLFQYLKY